MIAWLKRLTAMRHGTRQSWVWELPRGSYPYARDLGEGLHSSAIMAVVQWLQRAFPEAPLVVERRQADAWEVVPEHPLSQLIARPNPYYAGEQLWMATVWSWCVAGNAYWGVVRTNGGRPAQLWYIPHALIEPKWPQDGREFISHYEYKPDGSTPQRLEPEDLIHFRHGIDPRNPRLGLSPIASVVREVWTDDEAGRFVAALLRNSAVPSVVLSPKGDGVLPLDLQAVKEYLQDQFTGDRRGAPLALGAPTDVSRLGFAPSDLDLSAVRDVAEERICAALGVPAPVVGFGTGLQSTKVGATLREYVGLAWSNGVIPVQRIMGGEIGRSLLPGFGGNGSVRVTFDYGKVQALQEDEGSRASRYNVMVTGGWLKVSEARRAMGLEADDADEVYLRSIAVQEVRPGEAVMPMPEPAPTNGSVAKQLTLPPAFVSAAIAGNALRVDKPPPQLQRLANQLYRIQRENRPRFEADLMKAFDALGRQVARATAAALGQKAMPEDILDAQRISLGLQMEFVQQQFLAAYARHYRRTSIDVFETVGTMFGLETDIPDFTARAILATGGRRLGLLDLEATTKERLFQELTKARAEGLGIDAIVQRLKTFVPAGPWADSATRARITSRTETAYATNLASYHRARDVDGIEHALMFDSRLGSFDQECDLVNGMIVTLDEARLLIDAEHPNGTRSMTGLPRTLLQEMQQSGDVGATA